MGTDQTFVIVGAGLAGAKAAQALRDADFEGRIVLIGEEGERPYERPPLSKSLLQDDSGRDQIFVHDANWYGQHRVELRTGTRVTSIDRTDRRVLTADGWTLAYDKLLLATGSSPRRLDLPGVLHLRTLADHEHLTRGLGDGRRLVIIGAGWIGLEVAAAARARGTDVTVIEAGELPLQRILGDDVARIFADLHRHHGVTFHFGASVREVRPREAGSTVELADGTTLTADVVLAAVGALPNVELADKAGLAVDDGIVVDERLRTSDPHIYAAGDVARAHHPVLGRTVRVEHWANALNGGPAAARAMLGDPAPYDRLPYFYTDQHDLSMEYSGYAAPGDYDRVVFRGDPSVRPGAGPEFLAFWVRDGRVLAGMNVNVWDVTQDIQKLVRAGYGGRSVDPAALTDPGTPLASLL